MKAFFVQTMAVNKQIGYWPLKNPIKFQHSNSLYHLPSLLNPASLFNLFQLKKSLRGCCCSSFCCHLPLATTGYSMLLPPGRKLNLHLNQKGSPSHYLGWKVVRTISRTPYNEEGVEGATPRPGIGVVSVIKETLS